MSPKQTTLKAGSCNLQQCWRSVYIAISSILFLTHLKTFSVIPLIASLCFLWLKTQHLHPCLTFLHAPYPLTGSRYEITPSLAQSPSPCLGPLMSLPLPSNTQHRFGHTNLSWMQKQLSTNCWNIWDESSCSRSCLLLSDARQPGEQTGAELGRVQTSGYKYQAGGAARDG